MSQAQLPNELATFLENWTTDPNNAKDAFENEHFKSRGDWITYEDQTVGADITAFGIAPKMSETPGNVWRGAPSLGQDTDAVLKTILGYDDAKIADLREKKLI